MVGKCIYEWLWLGEEEIGYSVLGVIRTGGCLTVGGRTSE